MNNLSEHELCKMKLWKNFASRYKKSTGFMMYSRSFILRSIASASVKEFLDDNPCAFSFCNWDLLRKDFARTKLELILIEVILTCQALAKNSVDHETSKNAVYATVKFYFEEYFRMRGKRYPKIVLKNLVLMSQDSFNKFRSLKRIHLNNINNLCWDYHLIRQVIGEKITVKVYQIFYLLLDKIMSFKED